MKNQSIISYGGYYSTGGSAIRDIFREFSPLIDFPTEFRIIKERGGLLDLDRAINIEIAPENVGLAVQKFLWLSQNLARKNSRFSRCGFSYDDYTNGLFKKISEDYISSLIDYYYPMDWHYIRFGQSWVRQIIDKAYKKYIVLDRRKLLGRNLYPMVALPDKFFVEKTRNYFLSLFEAIRDYRNINKNSILGLHNAVPIFHPELIERVRLFVPGIKVFIVDRDPRDNFLNLSKDSYSRYLPKNCSILKKAQFFINFYKSVRRNKEKLKEMDNVYLYNFEDFCLNYEDTLKRFLNESKILLSANHQFKSKIFNPEESKKNIFIYKKISKDTLPAIKLIEKHLEEYLYNE